MNSDLKGYWWQENNITMIMLMFYLNNVNDEINTNDAIKSYMSLTWDCLHDT